MSVNKITTERRKVSRSLRRAGSCRDNSRIRVTVVENFVSSLIALTQLALTMLSQFATDHTRWYRPFPTVQQFQSWTRKTVVRTTLIVFAPPTHRHPPARLPQCRAICCTKGAFFSGRIPFPQTVD